MAFLYGEYARTGVTTGAIARAIRDKRERIQVFTAANATGLFRV